MKVLIVDQNAAESAALATVVRERGHVALCAQNEAEAASLASKELPQFVLSEKELAAAGDFALIRSIRALKAPHYIFCSVFAKDFPDEQLVAAYKAGVDSDFRRPFGRAHIVAHALAAERVSGISLTAAATDAKRVAAPAVNGAPVNGAAVNGTPVNGAPVNGATVNGATVNGKPVNGHDSLAPARADASPFESLCGSTAWKDASASMRDAASKFLTLPVELDLAVPKQPPMGLASSVVLLNVQQQLELRIAVAASPSSAKALAMHLFGEDSTEMAEDMLSELTNILMGTLKAKFGAESISFAAGIPGKIGPAEVMQPKTTYQRQEVFQLSLLNEQVLIHLGVRSKANMLIAVPGLQEGMVLAKNVFNARGMLLLNEGTRLSTNMVEHIQSILPPKQMVEVMPA